MATYKVEPYVVAADVYAFAPHTGRGGWTWYTGAAAWMYRLIVEYLLGVKREGDKLSFAPCLPAQWDGFSLRYLYGKTTYQIAVTRARRGKDETGVFVDGTGQEEKSFTLTDDGVEHRVDVII
jgi:cellobiose phosphorylase